MAFGPCWHAADEDRGVSGALAAGELLALAGRVAAELIAELERGARLTGHWNDHELGYLLVEAAMSRAMARLAASRCWGKANETAATEFWRTAGPVLRVGELQLRARDKPRGYAGDYEMFARICRNQCCDHPLGRLFDRYFLAQAAPRAVVARTEQTAAALAADCLSAPPRPYRLASVGCGAALDVAEAMARLPAAHRDQVRVTLLDLDEDALDFAGRELAGLMADATLARRRENLYRLASRPSAAALLDGSDFVVCSGLFDYLPDEPAAEILEYLWKQLGAGGQLLVGNFAPHCPSRAYMEWVGAWYLIYRTPEELAALAIAADIPAEHFCIGAERLGVDLFLVAHKPAGTTATT